MKKKKNPDVNHQGLRIIKLLETKNIASLVIFRFDARN